MKKGFVFLVVLCLCTFAIFANAATETSSNADSAKKTVKVGACLTQLGDNSICDQLYGGRPRPPKGASEEFLEVLRNFKRQALHAAMLRLEHPITGELMEWHAPLPDDFIALIQALKADYNLYKDELDY